jgi:hypothetical protein
MNAHDVTQPGQSDAGEAIPLRGTAARTNSRADDRNGPITAELPSAREEEPLGRHHAPRDGRLRSVTHEKTLAKLKALHGRPPSFCEPCDTPEEFAIRQIFWDAEQLERLKRARKVLWKAHIEETALREEIAAVVLGRQLLFDPRDCGSSYRAPRSSRARPKLQTPGTGETSDPARLLENLESTAAGCRWLVERWAELRANLEPGERWFQEDLFKLVRLMGRELKDVLEDPELAEAFFAGCALDRRQGNAFTELRSELRVDQIKARLRRMRSSATSPLDPCDRAQARERLIGIIERATAWLEAKAEEHTRRAEADASEEAVARAFDQTPRGQAMLREERDYARALGYGISTLMSLRRMAQRNDRLKRERGTR